MIARYGAELSGDIATSQGYGMVINDDPSNPCLSKRKQSRPISVLAECFSTSPLEGGEVESV